MIAVFLGVILCGIAGFIDRNPTFYRFFAVILSYSVGMMLINYGV